MFSVFLSSYKVIELEKAVETLVLPNFHSCFYNSVGVFCFSTTTI